MTREELTRLLLGQDPLKMVDAWMTSFSVPSIPLGATGKMQKNKLRDNLADYRLPEGHRRKRRIRARDDSV